MESDGADSDSTWTQVRSKTQKRRRTNRGSVELETFQSMSADEKLNVLFGKITNIELAHDDIRHVTDTLTSTCKRVEKLESSHQIHDKQIQMLNYKLINMETQLRKQNLIVYKLEETGEQTTVAEVGDFLYYYLDLDPEELSIVDAFRLGPKPKPRPRASLRGRAEAPTPRPILVTFAQSSDVDLILSYAKHLKNTRYSIDRDYPPEIQAARKRIWPEYKKLRAEKGSNVRLVFPAAIVVGGIVVIDEFPDWDLYVKGKRSKPTVANTQQNNIAQIRVDTDTKIESNLQSDEGSGVTVQSGIQSRSDLHNNNSTARTDVISTYAAAAQSGSQPAVHSQTQSADVFTQPLIARSSVPRRTRYDVNEMLRERSLSTESRRRNKPNKQTTNQRNTPAVSKTRDVPTVSQQ